MEFILQAHDRALEEARFSPFLTDLVKEIVEGKKAVNKVFTAVEDGRREAVQKLNDNTDETADFFAISENGVMPKIEEFAKDWIALSIGKLGDWPEGVLEMKNAAKLFQRLMSNEESVLPRSLVRYMVEPLPDPWDHIKVCLKEVYAEAAEKAEIEAEKSGKKRRKDE